MPDHDFRFPRTELASRLADDLIGKGPFDYRSGLFLAAPRRTGKSTFLREDLVPALAAREVMTTYVDLWSDRARDPADLIRAAFADAHEAAGGWLRRLVQRIRPRTVSIAGIAEIDLDRAGPPDDGATMTEVLMRLAHRAKSDIALVVDEAQHALSTPAGLNAMFALKAARDAFNQSRTPNAARLALVFTGSDRNKLSNLVLKRDQPFFGARLQDFPRLEDGYCSAYAAWINPRLHPDQQFDADQLVQAFDIVGRRPELLTDVVQDALTGAGAASVIAAAEARRSLLLSSYAGEFNALPPLQQHLLRALVKEGPELPVFADATLRQLSDALGSPAKASQVQAALDGLRKKELIWTSARGVYAVEDQDMTDWLRTADSGSRS